MCRRAVRRLRVVGVRINSGRTMNATDVDCSSRTRLRSREELGKIKKIPTRRPKRLTRRLTPATSPRRLLSRHFTLQGLLLLRRRRRHRQHCTHRRKPLLAFPPPFFPPFVSPFFTAFVVDRSGPVWQRRDEKDLLLPPPHSRILCRQTEIYKQQQYSAQRARKRRVKAFLGLHSKTLARVHVITSASHRIASNLRI